MKTYKYLLTLVLCAMIAGAGRAQNYYTPGRTIQGNGFTYISELDPGPDTRYPNVTGGITRVRSVYNTLTNQPPMLNGQPLPLGDSRQTIVGDDTNSLAVMYNAASAVMTPTDRQNAMEENLLIHVRIDPQTGRIREVEFMMNPAANGFIRIAPEKLYAVEKALKEQVVFQISPFGKTLNFVSTLLPFRGRDIGAYYDFATGRWYNPGEAPPLPAPTISSTTPATSTLPVGAHIVVTVRSPQAGVSYEWERDGKIVSGVSGPTYSFYNERAFTRIRDGEQPPGDGDNPAPSRTRLSVRCRARSGARVSEQSNYLAWWVYR